ncbi:MAG: hypothetical protein IT424_16285 [Pirellulales bacterium]|nr:hypothetical protein [Pirellulales bacterium]
MKLNGNSIIVGLVLATLSMAVSADRSLAANSFSNSLTGFSGNSTLQATQEALAAAGFEASSTAGLAEDFSTDPTVVFDVAGASFGTLFAGDGGRNYLRTVDNYAFDSYVAEVTAVVDTLATDVVFFGMGSGIIDLWGTPDFAGRPTIFLTPENGLLKANGADGISGDWINPAGEATENWSDAEAPGLVGESAGTHRLRMTLDAEAKTWTGSVDIDYAGGPFVADVSTPTYNLTTLYDDGGFVTIGFPTNPSKIYFGGDDGVIFKDFSVTVGGSPSADFNDDGAVDGADFLIWQRGAGSGSSFEQGDATGNGVIDGEDLDVWRDSFGGPAAQVAISAVPEPTMALLALAGLLSLHVARRAT